MFHCSECGSARSYEDTQTRETYCANCGLLVDDVYFEKQNYIPEGNCASLPQLSVAGGAGVDGKIVKRSWLYSTKEKNLMAGELKIELICSQIKVPELVVKEAKLLFRRIVEKGLTVGRSNLSFVYACVYAGCNIHGIPKTPLEITISERFPIKDLMKAYKILIRQLKLNCTGCYIPDLIHSFGSRIGVSPTVQKEAASIYFILHTFRCIAGKKPRTIAATLIYLAGKINGEKITQRKIANTTGVLEVTIRKRSKEIEFFL